MSRPYSVVSLATGLPEVAKKPNTFQFRFMQCCFALFALAVPAIYPWLLVVLWWAPLRNKQQRRLLVLAQVMNAWSALDVLVLSVCAAVVEIEQYALFIVGDKCDLLN